MPNDAVTQIAGPASGTPPAAGTPGAPGAAAPAAGAAFTWAPDLDAPIVDLLKSKGMYDDPVKGTKMLATSYFEANKALSGGDVIIAPKDWNDQAAVDKFLAKTRGTDGATIDGYKPKFADGVEVSAPLVEFSRKLGHMWGVPPALFQKGIDEWQKFAAEQNTQFQTARAKANDDAIKALETKYGPDVFKANIAAGQNVYKALAATGKVSRETLVALDANVGSAVVIELLAAVGSGMKEGAVIGNGGGAAPTDPGQMTAEQAQAAVKLLQADAEFQKKYLDKKDPGHVAAVERMKLLYEAMTRRPG